MEPEDFQHHSEDKQVDNQSRHDDSMLDAPAPAKVKEQSSIGSAIKEKGQSPLESASEQEPATTAKSNVPVGKKGDMSVNQNIALLEGKSSFFSNVKSFFGNQSTFIQLQKKIDELTLPNLKQPEKDKIKSEVLRLGNEWLTKHSDPSNENDKKKRNSIQKIVDGLNRETSIKSSKEASKTSDKKDPEIATPKEFEIVSMKNKLTFAEKVKSALTFSDTEFEEIEKDFENHLGLASGKVTDLGVLFGIVKSTSQLKIKVENCRRKIENSTNENDIKKIIPRIVLR